MAQKTVPEARLRFLNDSAHLMLFKSRSTSAHLITQRNALLFGLELDVQTSRQACTACGTIFIAGETASVKFTRGHVLYTCNSCGDQTRQAIGGTKSKARRNTPALNSKMKNNSASSHDVAAAATATTTTSAKTTLDTGAESVTAHVKKSAHERRKMRKQGGFQALLANKAASKPKSGFGLDLMDFMK